MDSRSYWAGLGWVFTKHGLGAGRAWVLTGWVESSVSLSRSRRSRRLRRSEVLPPSSPAGPAGCPPRRPHYLPAALRAGRPERRPRRPPFTLSALVAVHAGRAGPSSLSTLGDWSAFCPVGAPSQAHPLLLIFFSLLDRVFLFWNETRAQLCFTDSRMVTICLSNDAIGCLFLVFFR